MAQAISIYEVGSEDFTAFQARLKGRAENADAELGSRPAELLERARATGDGPFVAFAEEFYRDLPPTATATVQRVIAAVQKGSDEAVCHLARLFDGKELPLARMKVSKAELMQFAAEADADLLRTCREQVLPRLRRFHEKQKIAPWQIEEQGGSVGVRIQPLARVGLYVPGGSAFYPSTLMMTAVPAQVAGVGEIAVFTPQGGLEANPLLAALLLELKLEEVYRIGGAQAVAAAALGTPKVARVDKIVGPGNIFVAQAKRQLSGRVGIDSFAGPSEVVIVFDGGADPACVAADLLAQAEHDALAAAVAVTDNADAAAAVQAQVDAQLAALPRAGIAARSLRDFGGVIVAPSKGFALRIADSLAPEHLELLTETAEKDSAMVRNAGAVFVGAFAPEAFGDYCAGPNHVLPTAGTARFAQALSVADFTRHVSIIKGSREMLAANRDAIVKLARAEGLEAHARSVEKRFS
ncbi:MAG: histidinol dehydrogenase [Planctomycetes bacterium]|nr:histidinol dehydrogenase [Planctomycetota bacterium]